jgi:hypothetical protein
MAALPETPFTSLLRADSEHPLPDSDPDVIAAVNAYGGSFTKVKKNAAARMDLLAGLMWVHAHQLDLHAVWSAASVAQHRALAAALRLDYDLHAASSTWLTMVVRTVLSCIAPGATPEMRKAPTPPSTARSRCLGPMMALPCGKEAKVQGECEAVEGLLVLLRRG